MTSPFSKKDWLFLKAIFLILFVKTTQLIVERGATVSSLPNELHDQSVYLIRSHWPYRAAIVSAHTNSLNNKLLCFIPLTTSVRWVIERSCPIERLLYTERLFSLKNGSTPASF